MTELPTTWHNTRVTVMGLGSFGGGVGLARYLATQGADVTVTDLKPPEALQASLEALQPLPIRYVLGEHREADFRDTDVVFGGFFALLLQAQRAHLLCPPGLEHFLLRGFASRSYSSSEGRW